MSFRDYFREMSAAEQAAFALRANTTANYIRCHLISVPPRKIPRRELMDALIEASNGRLSMVDMLQHFYPDAQEARP